MTTYHTTATLLPPTPHGLLPARWHIRHTCTTCGAHVSTDDLLAHAQQHHNNTIDHHGGAID
jgi:hypothetical protein